MPEGFSVDVSKAAGHVYPAETVACTRRDYLMYALSVGVPENDLRWLYELGNINVCLSGTNSH